MQSQRVDDSGAFKAQEKGMEGLRQEIMRGVEDIQQGRFATYGTDADLEAFSDEIISL